MPALSSQQLFMIDVLCCVQTVSIQRHMSEWGALEFATQVADVCGGLCGDQASQPLEALEQGRRLLADLCFAAALYC